MLHHISFAVRELQRAASFYDAALAPLGFVRVWSDDTAVGYGYPGGDDKLALKLVPEGIVIPGPGFHLALAAQTRDQVDRFHAAALAHGGRDNGPPGLRPDYAPTITLRSCSIPTAIGSKPSSIRRADGYLSMNCSWPAKPIRCMPLR